MSHLPQRTEEEISFLVESYTTPWIESMIDRSTETFSPVTEKIRDLCYTLKICPNKSKNIPLDLYNLGSLLRTCTRFPKHLINNVIDVSIPASFEQRDLKVTFARLWANHMGNWIIPEEKRISAGMIVYDVFNVLLKYFPHELDVHWRSVLQTEFFGLIQLWANGKEEEEKVSTIIRNISTGEKQENGSGFIDVSTEVAMLWNDINSENSSSSSAYFLYVISELVESLRILSGWSKSGDRNWFLPRITVRWNPTDIHQFSAKQLQDFSVDQWSKGYFKGFFASAGSLVHTKAYSNFLLGAYEITGIRARHISEIPMDTVSIVLDNGSTLGVLRKDEFVLVTTENIEEEGEHSEYVLEQMKQFIRIHHGNRMIADTRNVNIPLEWNGDGMFILALLSIINPSDFLSIVDLAQQTKFRDQFLEDYSPNIYKYFADTWITFNLCNHKSSTLI